jgi:hypothetical protein
VEDVPRGPIKDIFAAVACSRSRIFSKKRNDANIYGQTPSREILERKYLIQRVSREQKGDGNYG